MVVHSTLIVSLSIEEVQAKDWEANGYQRTRLKTSYHACKFILHLKINTRLLSLAHSIPLRTHACRLACVMLRDCMEVFMDDFTVYSTSFDACLENLS
ncbi:hypothetical protein CR513_05120, partial [Mucuna pruriens]